MVPSPASMANPQRAHSSSQLATTKRDFRNILKMAVIPGLTTINTLILKIISQVDRKKESLDEGRLHKEHLTTLPNQQLTRTRNPLTLPTSFFSQMLHSPCQSTRVSTHKLVLLQTRFAMNCWTSTPVQHPSSISTPLTSLSQDKHMTRMQIVVPTMTIN